MPVDSPSWRRSSVVSKAPIPLVRHATFYFENAIFLVEETLFKVPRAVLTRESDTIRAMFELPTPGGVPLEGSCDEHPIRLDGVKKTDFVALMDLLFQHPSHRDTLTTGEWVSILKMATMWDMADTRTLAITTLTYRPLNPVDKIVYSQHLDVIEWQRPAMVELVQRKEHLTGDEAKRLGWDLAMALAQAHERFAVVKLEYDLCSSDYYIPGMSTVPSAEDIVDEVLNPSKHAGAPRVAPSKDRSSHSRVRFEAE